MGELRLELEKATTALAAPTALHVESSTANPEDPGLPQASDQVEGLRAALDEANAKLEALNALHLESADPLNPLETTEREDPGLRAELATATAALFFFLSYQL